MFSTITHFRRRVKPVQMRRIYRSVLVLAAGVVLPLATAHAGDMYQCSVIHDPSGSSDFMLTKPGNKIKIVPSPASMPGTGMVMQLILKNVDCPLEGNDKNTAGKCGVAATKATPAAPVDAILAVGVYYPPLNLVNVFGVPVQFTKGVATFTATGKNKVDGATVAGAFVGAVLGASMGFEAFTVRKPGSDPTNVTTGCSVGPPLPAGNTCLDGEPFAMSGIKMSM